MNIPTIRQLTEAAKQASDAYESNKDESQEAKLLQECEAAEQALYRHARYVDAASALLRVIDQAILIADKESGAIHKGEAYDIGRAKREVALRISAGVRALTI